MRGGEERGYSPPVPTRAVILIPEGEPPRGTLEEALEVAARLGIPANRVEVAPAEGDFGPRADAVLAMLADRSARNVRRALGTVDFVWVLAPRAAHGDCVLAVLEAGGGARDRRLSRRVLSGARELAVRARLDLRVVVAWQPPILPSYLPSGDARELLLVSREGAQDQVQSMAGDLRLTRDSWHLEAGSVAEVAAGTARRSTAWAVAIGAAARRGVLSRLQPDVVESATSTPARGHHLFFVADR
jgi:hypothetical protein